MATNGAKLQRIAPGRYLLSGELDFGSVPPLWRELDAVIGPEGDLALDLAGVTRANSAGLALLFEALETASRREVKLVLEHITPGLRALASLSGSEQLLD